MAEVQSNSEQQAQPNKYNWVNRQQYSQDGIPQLGLQVAKNSSTQSIQPQIINLFRKVLFKSQASLLYLNDQTRKMSLYTIPHKSTSLVIYPELINFLGSVSDSNQYLTYGWGLQKQNGGRGYNLTLSASKFIGAYVAEIGYFKNIGQRVDNNFKSNTDKVYLSCKMPSTKYYDSLSFYLNRQSRTNYLSSIDNKESKESVLGLTTADRQLLKHSNLWSLVAFFQKSGVWTGAKLGWDYANKSYFICHGFSFRKNVEVGQSIVAKLSFQGAQIWGKNILKNDLLFRNKSYWPGSRSRNYLTPRAQIVFTRYPYLSVLGFNPYLYAQAWSSYTQHSDGSADYGVGVASSNYNIKLDVSLLKISCQRQAGVFGFFKFSF